MVSHKDFLDIFYDGVTCFIPTDELTEDQKERLDNIYYSLCDCPSCKKVLTSQKTDWKTLGHANKKTRVIGISHDSIRFLIGTKELHGPPRLLLDLTATILHEIIHIVFPHYSEKQVEDKTFEWLNSFKWNEKFGDSRKEKKE